MGLDSIITPQNLNLPQPGDVRRASLSAFQWTGKAAPTGNTFAIYAFSVSGKQVHFWFRISADKPGKRVTGIKIPLPEGMPKPDAFTARAVSELCVGHGLISKTSLTEAPTWRKPARQGLFTLRHNGFGVFSFELIAKPIPATHAWGYLSYYA